MITLLLNLYHIRSIRISTTDITTITVLSTKMIVTIYEVWQKSIETDFLFTKVFIFFKYQCSPLGQLHTDGDVVPTFDSSAGSFQPLRSSACPLLS